MNLKLENQLALVTGSTAGIASVTNGAALRVDGGVVKSPF